MQADKQASKRATENAGGRSSKAELQAKDADISIPDGPAKMFNFAALDADEEGFGLFDEHHSSSMAALQDMEGQHSFENIDAELFSQGLGPEVRVFRNFCCQQVAYRWIVVLGDAYCAQNSPAM